MSKSDKLKKLFNTEECLKITPTSLQKAVQAVDNRKTYKKVVLVVQNWSTNVIDELVTACTLVQALKPEAIW